MTSTTRYDVILKIVHLIFRPLFAAMYGLKYEKFSLGKDRPCLVLCNHQSFWDPVFVSTVYDRPIHFMATDNIFTDGLVSKLLKYFLAPIPKKKQVVDLKAIKMTMQIAKANGVVGIFPEGSCSYDGNGTSVVPGVAQLARKIKADIALCNLEGAYGTIPRWGNKKRKGIIRCFNRKYITYEESASMTEAELSSEISESLVVKAPPYDVKYRSEKRAEYLERCVYICPSCGRKNTLVSSGNIIRCSTCGLESEYREDCTIRFNRDLGITTLAEWLALQKKQAEELFRNDPDECLFEDRVAKIASYKSSEDDRIRYGEGLIRLSRDGIHLLPDSGEVIYISADAVKAISPVSGIKLMIGLSDITYFLVGNERFNPYKYAQMLNFIQGCGEKEIK